MSELSLREKEMLVRKTFPEKKILNLQMLLFPEKSVKKLIEERVKTCSVSPFALDGKYGQNKAVKSIPKKEGIEIAVNMAERRELLVPFYPTIMQLLSKDPHLYFRIPMEQRTEEQTMYVAKRIPRHMCSHMNDKSFNVKKAFVESMESDVIPKGLFDNCSDAEVLELISINPDCVSALPKERFTKEILYYYLEQLVKRNLKPVLNKRNVAIPEELKDKVYYRALCMVSGYCYSLVPEDKREEYITPKVVEYSLSHIPGNGTDFVFMAQYMPDKCKTKEVCKQLIKKHAFTAKHLPKNLQNDEFYRELMDVDPKFIEHIDFETASSEVLAEGFERCKNILLYNKKIPKKKWSKELAKAIAKSSNNFTIIPKEYQTKETAYIFLEKHASIDQIPKAILDEEMCLFAVRHHCYALRHIPEKFLTESFWKICKKENLLQSEQVPESILDEEWTIRMVEGGNISFFDQIKKDYRTKKVILKFAEFQKRNREIPKKYQTEEIVRLLYDNWDIDTPYTEKYFWSTIREDLRDKDALDRLAGTVESSIEILLTKEQIESNLVKWPENILFAPEWYLDKYVRQIPENKKEAVEETTKDELEIVPMPVKATNNIEQFKQLTIWDVLFT